MEKRFRRLPDRLYFFGLLPALAALPRRPSYWLARQLGRALQRKHPEFRQAILRNLTRLQPLPNGGKSVREQVAQCFEHLACEDLDSYYYRCWSPHNLDRYFETSGLEHLDRALEKGKGAVLLTGHVGGVCAGMVALGILGYPIHHVARDYRSNTSIESAFRDFALVKIRWMEARMGHPLIDAPGGEPSSLASAVLRIKQALSSNHLVSMALDVDPGWVTDSLAVDFLDGRYRFTSSLVRLAHACDCPIIPYFNTRHPQSWHRHRLQVRPRLPLSGDLQADVQRCAAELEAVIRDDPPQWFSWDSLARFRADQARH